MKRLKTNEEERFRDFLNLVNSCEPGKLPDIDEVIRDEERHTGISYNARPDIFLKEALRRVLPDSIKEPAEFYKYLFGKDSPDDLELDEDTHGDDISLDRAYNYYQLFRVNAQDFDDLMTRLDLIIQHEGPIKEIRQVHRTTQYIDFVIDKTGQLQVVPVERNHFHGFRDFARIKKCPFCSNRFVQERTDQVFCGENCRNANKQKKWRENEENRLKVLKEKRERYEKEKKDIRDTRRLNREYKKTLRGEK